MKIYEFQVHEGYEWVGPADDGDSELGGVPLSRLQKATGLSLRYFSAIRRGERTPRHLQALVDAAAD